MERSTLTGVGASGAGGDISEGADVKYSLFAFPAEDNFAGEFNLIEELELVIRPCQVNPLTESLGL